MPKLWIGIVAVSALLVVSALTMLDSAGAAEEYAVPATPVINAHLDHEGEDDPIPPKSQDEGVEGLPAITPKASVQLGKVGVTTEEVADFVSSYVFMFQEPGSPHPEIVSIDFTSVHTANERYEMNIGAWSETPICVVTVKGSFVNNRAGGENPPRGTTGYLVFDASTGNILSEGAGP